MEGDQLMTVESSNSGVGCDYCGRITIPDFNWLKVKKVFQPKDKPLLVKSGVRVTNRKVHKYELVQYFEDWGTWVTRDGAFYGNAEVPLFKKYIVLP